MSRYSRTRRANQPPSPDRSVYRRICRRSRFSFLVPRRFAPELTIVAKKPHPGSAGFFAPRPGVDAGSSSARAEQRVALSRSGPLPLATVARSARSDRRLRDRSGSAALGGPEIPKLRNDPDGPLPAAGDKNNVVRSRIRPSAPEPFLTLRHKAHTLLQMLVHTGKPQYKVCSDVRSGLTGQLGALTINASSHPESASDSQAEPRHQFSRCLLRPPLFVHDPFNPPLRAE